MPSFLSPSPSFLRVIVRPNVTGIAVGFTKRVAILSSEIGMLGDSGYLDAVQAMSATPSVFHEKFAEAFVSDDKIGSYRVVSCLVSPLASSLYG